MKDNFDETTAKRNKVSNRTIQFFLKRFFDVVTSLLILIALSPIFLLLAIWIIIDDGFPVFYKQKRSGINNTVFQMYKFRSMKNKQVPVPSNTHPYDEWNDGVPDDFVFKLPSEDNPNITSVGRVIRKYSLDDLPQFINVLKGDMSIIGPRPEILAISKHYNEEQQSRLRVLPGITGWTQVNGRSNMDHGEKIRHDLYYVHHFSLWLDIKIFFKTIYQVIGGKDSA